MVDPLVGLVALSLKLAAAPTLPSLDPGPSPYCPEDMRLVEGTHHDRMFHLCLDTRTAHKYPLCYAYAEGVSALEGPVSAIRVCMDQFEAPNRRGAAPLVMQSYKSASRRCQRLGKRLCTEQEWEMACEGPEHLPLAYGWSVDVKLCNSNKRWKAPKWKAFSGNNREEARRESNRLWQGSPSGRYRTCVSPFGIFDMMGNVEEWVASRTRRRFPGSLMGGFWAKPWTGCRGTNDAHQPTFAFYETGFRCCKDPVPPRDAAAPAATTETDAAGASP